MCRHTFFDVQSMEGPSLVILKEALTSFKGKRITAVSGSSKIDQQKLLNEKIADFKSWGKHFLIVFKNFSIRIHFLMFGSYRIDEYKDAKPRLSLEFSDNHSLNFYTCAIIMIEDDLDKIYNWECDVMNDAWNAKKARQSLRKNPERFAGDVLLDQTIFAGVGNIIKNEVLFRIRVHPDSLIGAIPPRKLTELINEAKNYSFDFYEWKKLYELKKHWLIYGKKVCPRCKMPVIKIHTGLTKRRSFFCENCQTKYG